MNQQAAEDGRTLSVIAYLTIFGAVIALIMNNERKNPFTAFHVRQGLGLCLSYMLIGYFLFIGNIQNHMVYISFWICFGILFLYGIIGAISGKTNKVPVLGAFFQKLFSGLNN